MKVILRQDIEKLGDRGDIKEVKSGYARNYLIPRGLAVAANRSNLKTLEEQKRVDERKEKKIEEKLTERADFIAGSTVEISARAGAEGRIYGSVTAAQISAALKEKFDLEIDKRRVLLDSPIKNIGEHTVNMRLSPGQEVPVKVIVTPEGGIPDGETDDEPEKAPPEPEPETETAEEPQAAVEPTDGETDEEPVVEEEPAEEPEPEKALPEEPDDDTETDDEPDAGPAEEPEAEAEPAEEPVAAPETETENTKNSSQ